MNKRLSSAAVCKAVKYATAAGSRRAAFPNRRAVAEHYAVSPSTLARWVRDFAGLSVASVDKVRKPVGVRYRKSAQMYGISPRYADSAEGRTGKLIAWQSEDGDVSNSGRVEFLDGPPGHGTFVRAVMAYEAPMGVIGKAVAKLTQKEPQIQSTRDLRRFKQLMETGEIATTTPPNREPAS